MPLPSSGLITLQDINEQLGIPFNNPSTLNDPRIRTLLNVPSGTIFLQNGHGISNGLVFSIEPLNSSSWPGSGTTVFDVSGNNNHGTLVNGVIFHGDNFLLTGPSFQHINAAHSTSIDIRRTITINIWFWLRSFPVGGLTIYGNWTNLLNKQNDQVGHWTEFLRTYSIFIRGDGLNYFHLATMSSTGVQDALDTPNNTVQLYRWINYTGLINRNTGIMSNFINGSLINSGPCAIIDTVSVPHPLTIGLRLAGSHHYVPLDAHIGVTQVYNRALNATEINDLFQFHRLRYGI